MKCMACGEENVEGAKFCAFCGKKLALREAAHGAPSDEASPEAFARAEGPEDARERRAYARPLPENPIQPRRMPHMASKDAGPQDAPPLEREPADERPAGEDSLRKVAGRPYIRPDPKKMFLFDDELTEEQAPRASKRTALAKRPPEPRRRRDAYDAEDEEDIERKSRAVIRFFAVLTALVLIASTLLFATHSDAGRRLRTQLGWGVSAQDYLHLADWQLAHGINEDAAASYYKAFLMDNDDFDNCLLVAAGFDRAGVYERAEQVYVYMMDTWPERDEPYDRLLALLDKQGKDQEYDALLNFRSVNQAGTNQVPIPAAPTASLPGGEYITKIQLQLTAEDGADIRYSLDGSEPSESSLLYTGPFTITGGKYTIRAIAIKNGVASREWTATYVINAAA